MESDGDISYGWEKSVDSRDNAMSLLKEKDRRIWRLKKELHNERQKNAHLGKYIKDCASLGQKLADLVQRSERKDGESSSSSTSASTSDISPLQDVILAGIRQLTKANYQNAVLKNELDQLREMQSEEDQNYSRPLRYRISGKIFTDSDAVDIDHEGQDTEESADIPLEVQVLRKIVTKLREKIILKDSIFSRLKEGNKVTHSVLQKRLLQLKRQRDECLRVLKTMVVLFESYPNRRDMFGVRSRIDADSLDEEDDNASLGESSSNSQGNAADKTRRDLNLIVEELVAISSECRPETKRVAKNNKLKHVGKRVSVQVKKLDRWRERAAKPHKEQFGINVVDGHSRTLNRDSLINTRTNLTRHTELPVEKEGTTHAKESRIQAMVKEKQRLEKLLDIMHYKLTKLKQSIGITSLDTQAGNGDPTYRHERVKISLPNKIEEIIKEIESTDDDWAPSDRSLDADTINYLPLSSETKCPEMDLLIDELQEDVARFKDRREKDIGGSAPITFGNVINSRTTVKKIRTTGNISNERDIQDNNLDYLDDNSFYHRDESTSNGNIMKLKESECQNIDAKLRDLLNASCNFAFPNHEHEMDHFRWDSGPHHIETSECADALTENTLALQFQHNLQRTKLKERGNAYIEPHDSMSEQENVDEKTKGDHAIGLFNVDQLQCKNMRSIKELNKLSMEALDLKESLSLCASTLQNLLDHVMKSKKEANCSTQADKVSNKEGTDEVLKDEEFEFERELSIARNALSNCIRNCEAMIKCLITERMDIENFSRVDVDLKEDNEKLADAINQCNILSSEVKKLSVQLAHKGDVVDSLTLSLKSSEENVKLLSEKLERLQKDVGKEQDPVSEVSSGINKSISEMVEEAQSKIRTRQLDSTEHILKTVRGLISASFKKLRTEIADIKKFAANQRDEIIQTPANELLEMLNSAYARTFPAEHIAMNLENDCPVETPVKPGHEARAGPSKEEEILVLYNKIEEIDRLSQEKQEDIDLRDNEIRLLKDELFKKEEHFEEISRELATLRSEKELEDNQMQTLVETLQDTLNALKNEVLSLKHKKDMENLTLESVYDRMEKRNDYDTIFDILCDQLSGTRAGQRELMIQLNELQHVCIDLRNTIKDIATKSLNYPRPTSEDDVSQNSRERNDGVQRSEVLSPEQRSQFELRKSITTLQKQHQNEDELKHRLAESDRRVAQLEKAVEKLEFQLLKARDEVLEMQRTRVAAVSKLEQQVTEKKALLYKLHKDVGHYEEAIEKEAKLRKEKEQDWQEAKLKLENEVFRMSEVARSYKSELDDINYKFTQFKARNELEKTLIVDKVDKSKSDYILIIKAELSQTMKEKYAFMSKAQEFSSSLDIAQEKIKDLRDDLLRNQEELKVARKEHLLVQTELQWLQAAIKTAKLDHLTECSVPESALVK